jgi:hypothetical protein
MIQAPVSVGELIDKLSILHVKKTKITNKEKLEYINKEVDTTPVLLMVNLFVIKFIKKFING